MFSGNLTGSNTCTFILLKEYEYYTYVGAHSTNNYKTLVMSDLDPLPIKRVCVCVYIYIYTHTHTYTYT